MKNRGSKSAPVPQHLPEEGPTRERLAHAQNHYEIGGDTRGGLKLTTMRDSPIERALARRVITQSQYDAAMKFKNHWFRGGMAGTISSLDMDRVFASDVGSFSHMPKSEAQVFHRQQYRKAVEELGNLSAAVVESIVCNEVSFTDIGAKFGWGSKYRGIEAAEKFLRDSLQQLVRLWGI